ncbi:MAG: amidase family protein [Bacilli bacterium]|nr:amidase family protein [Bacilli bacterium]
MEFTKMTIDDLKQQLNEAKISPKELYNTSLALSKKAHEKLNIFETIIDDFQMEDANSRISGIPYALKDNFSTKGILTTASSNILNGYIPVYDATVYKKLKEAGAVLVGKTILDELAMGGTGTTGHTGTVHNPWHMDRLMGGSSAGSAAAVASGIVPFAIGSDTGDSVRKPAALGGIVGFKPSYGRISRYGLFAFASSLDHVAYFTRCVKDSAILTNILKGQDEYDMTSLEDDNLDYTLTLNDDIKGKKLFYFKDICDPAYYPNSSDETMIETLTKFQETLDKCRKLGFIIEEVSFDKELLNAIYPTYMIISCAEATSNNANLTGIQFGPRGEGDSIDEIMLNARTKGFSELIKRRFILGSYILQKENQEKLFLNAARIRRLIVDKMTELFKTYDGLIMPASSNIAPKFNDSSDRLSEEYLILENHLAIGNFGGFPSITLPSGIVKEMPVAINITGPVFGDKDILNIAYKIEEILGFKGLVKDDFYV